VTVEGKRADFDRLGELLGSKVKLASQEELREKTGCEARCAASFGYPEDIIIIFDAPGVMKHEKFLFSPGPPEKTLEIETKDIEKILGTAGNEVVRL
jgi:Ala-tRNA(Pro) deacylase